MKSAGARIVPAPPVPRLRRAPAEAPVIRPGTTRWLNTVSPLAPRTLATMPPIEGVRMATAAAGIKYKNRTDVLMMVFDRPAAVAGVFTRSLCPSAPVEFCRRNLGGRTARAVVVNSGNANAFTGRKGAEATADDGAFGRCRGRMPRAGGVPRLDRRDRRAARRDEVRRRPGRARRAGPAAISGSMPPGRS